MVCIDSDVVIDFLRKDKVAVKRMSELSARENVFITSINSFELFKGLRNSSMSEEELSEFVSNFYILDFNLEASQKAAEIFNQLKSEGCIIELPDIMIASIVITRNERLVTRNVRHFERIKGLRIEKL